MFFDPDGDKISVPVVYFPMFVPKRYKKKNTNEDLDFEQQEKLKKE